MKEEQNTSGTASVWDAATKKQLQQQNQQQQKELEENSAEPNVVKNDKCINPTDVSM